MDLGKITGKGKRHIGGVLFDLDYLTSQQLDEVTKVVEQEIVKNTPRNSSMYNGASVVSSL